MTAGVTITISVHRQFERAGQSLAELVAGQEQPLPVSRTGGMKLPLLGIGAIGRKLVEIDNSPRLCLQGLPRFGRDRREHIMLHHCDVIPKL